MIPTLSFILGVYFFLLIAFSFFKPKFIPGKTIYILRAFFPSWKLFEDIGNVPKLFYKISLDGKTFGDWTPCLEKPRRRLTTLFLNPQGSFLLACGSLLQQLESDIEDAFTADSGSNKDAFTADSVTYQVIQKLVEFQILKNENLSRSVSYQFKVCHFNLMTSQSDDFLVSPFYALEILK